MPTVMIASEREPREHGGPSGFRGRGRGRGGFAARGLAAAGLTRQQTEKRANGESAALSKDGV